MSNNDALTTPICSKACYQALKATLKKKKTNNDETKEETKNNFSRDKPGPLGKIAMDVLIDWWTTEGNYDEYRGMLM